MRIPVRLLAVGLGILWWLAFLLLATGEDGGVGQIWASLLFLVPLVAVGSLTRTIDLGLIGLMVLVGGALMGVMYVLSLLILDPALGHISRPRDFVVPTLEQLFVIAPVAYLVRRWRRARSWSLGATDLLLLGSAVGVGFGLLEGAFIREGRPDEWLSWLPIVAEQDRLIPGHAIWAGIGGATLGLGILVRHRGPIWLGVAASGSLVGLLDHIALNNYTWDDDLSRLLNTLAIDGWLVVGLFFVAAIACVAADLYVQLRLPAERRHAPIPGLPLPERWGHVLRQRALAHAWYQALRGSRSTDQFDAGLQAARIEWRSIYAGAGVGAVAVIALLQLSGLMVAPDAVGAVVLGLGDVGLNCDPACAAAAGGAAGGATAGGSGRGKPDPVEQEWEDERRKREQWKNQSNGPPGLRESREGPGGKVRGAPDRGVGQDTGGPFNFPSPAPTPQTFRDYVANDPGYKRLLGGGKD